MITCVGIRRFNYTSKKTGQTYPVANIYCTEERKGVDGVAAYDLFVRQALLPADIAPAKKSIAPITASALLKKSLFCDERI